MIPPIRAPNGPPIDAPNIAPPAAAPKTLEPSSESGSGGQ
ncbi:Putative uncharacterized protein [Moritella viscosa]|nr:Putative uncharacterized protein [Moritella viscosa]